MANPLLKETWIAHGTCKPKPNEKLAKDVIPVMEFPYSTQLQKDDPPYGRPIDAPTAVDMITNFWKRIKREMPHTWADFSLNFDTNFENFLSSKTEHKDKDARIKEAELALHWLFKFLSCSFAMTFDKSILLKILSQPQCEGVRFYMCSKSNLNQGSGELDQIMSLVLVGVDAKSQDLFYDAPDNNWVESQVNSVPTVSLLGEYGHPPGLFQKVMQEKVVEDAFALFKYAKIDLSKP